MVISSHYSWVAVILVDSEVTNVITTLIPITDNLKLEIAMRPVCLLMIFLLFTLPYLRNLIKDKLIDLIERTFDREGSPYLARNDKNLKISCTVLSKTPRRPSESAHENLVSLSHITMVRANCDFYHRQRER